MSIRKRGEVHIQSLGRANAILDVLVAQGTATLREISTATDLNKTTVYYLAESLASLGFAQRVGDGRGYCLGLRSLELGRAFQRRQDILSTSRPSLIRLCTLSRETVNLAVPYLYDSIIVESMEGTYGVRATSYAGSRAPYHATACGKAILANLEADVIETILNAHPLEPITLNTITNPQDLAAQLVEIRARGYSIDLEEVELNANCVAAPIWSGFDNVAGAISISGLASRLPQPVLDELAAAIISECQIIAKSLGSSISGTLL